MLYFNVGYTPLSFVICNRSKSLVKEGGANFVDGTWRNTTFSQCIKLDVKCNSDCFLKRLIWWISRYHHWTSSNFINTMSLLKSSRLGILIIIYIMHIPVWYNLKLPEIMYKSWLLNLATANFSFKIQTCKLCDKWLASLRMSRVSVNGYTHKLTLLSFFLSICSVQGPGGHCHIWAI